VGFPPCLLHLARNAFRALPCRPLALAWSEHAFEIACLLGDLPNRAYAELDGICDEAVPAAIVSDRTVAQTTIQRLISASIAVLHGSAVPYRESRLAAPASCFGFRYPSRLPGSARESGKNIISRFEAYNDVTPCWLPARRRSLEGRGRELGWRIFEVPDFGKSSSIWPIYSLRWATEKGVGERFESADEGAVLFIYSLPNEVEETSTNYLRDHYAHPEFGWLSPTRRLRRELRR
jgi:hypothetical protein